MFNIGITGQALLLNRIAFLFVTILMANGCFIDCLPSNSYAKKYDILTKKWVYEYVEIPPCFNNDEQGFIKCFNSNFIFSGNVEDMMPSRLNLQFVIDKRGNLIGARIYDKQENEWTSFERSAVDFTRECQAWQPGRHNGKPVNVLVSCPIIVDFR